MSTTPSQQELRAAIEQYANAKADLALHPTHESAKAYCKLAETALQEALASAQSEAPAMEAKTAEPVALTEPVTIHKALRAHREAHVVLESGTGPRCYVGLVNIQLTGWDRYDFPSARAYANGFNTGARLMRESMAAPADAQPAKAKVAKAQRPDGWKCLSCGSLSPWRGAGGEDNWCQACGSCETMCPLSATAPTAEQAREALRAFPYSAVELNDAAAAADHGRLVVVVNSIKLWLQTSARAALADAKERS